MPTVYNRVYAYSDLNKRPILSKKLKSALGHIVKDIFLKSGIKTPIEYIKAENKDCFGQQVINYPDEFTEILDKMVKEFYDNPPIESPKKVKKIKLIQAPLNPVLKVRKRKPIKGEPVFSSKLLKVN